MKDQATSAETYGIDDHADASVGTQQREAVRLRPSFDTRRLQAELAGVTHRPWYKQRIYDKRGVGAPAELDWRVLPLRSPGGDSDRTDPGGPGPDDFAPTRWLDQLPYLGEVLAEIPAPLNAARLMALGPGAVSAVHSDPKYSLRRGLVRLHLPITTNDAAVLVLDGVRHRWQPGELWFGEFCRPHHVQNHGDQPRIHLVIDALLTTALARLFPASWQQDLFSGNALINRPTASTAWEDTPLRGWSLEAPEAFTDFDVTDPLVERLGAPPLRISGTDGRFHLVDAAGHVFGLVHLGGMEFRFVGWSEQRTIQLHGSRAVLRVRKGRAVREATVPLDVATAVEPGAGGHERTGPGDAPQQS